MDHTYSFVSGMAVAFAIVSAACGGGGSDAPDSGEVVQPDPSVVWVPLPDYTEPVPPEQADMTDIGFVVRMVGNVEQAP